MIWNDLFLGNLALGGRVAQAPGKIDAHTSKALGDWVQKMQGPTKKQNLDIPAKKAARKKA